MKKDVSKDENACYEMQIDQFGWAATGSKKVPGAGNSVSGTLGAAVVQGFTGPFPTERGEVAQRGSVLISGVTFIIAAGNTVTIGSGVAAGGPVCLIPLADPVESLNDLPLIPLNLSH
ncbi:MAG: hypothetical protein ACREAB_19480 [Blastocatellia bacterium]